MEYLLIALIGATAFSLLLAGVSLLLTLRKKQAPSANDSDLDRYLLSQSDPERLYDVIRNQRATIVQLQQQIKTQSQEQGS